MTPEIDQQSLAKAKADVKNSLEVLKEDIRDEWDYMKILIDAAYNEFTHGRIDILEKQLKREPDGYLCCLV